MKTPLVKKIAFETLYPQQLQMADRVLRELEANSKPSTPHKRTPIVVLQPQQGKTGVCTGIIHKSIQECIRLRTTFQIVVLCGLPDLSLNELTKGRLTQGTGTDGKTRTGARLHAMALGAEDCSGEPLAQYGSPKLDEKGILVFHNSPKLKRLKLCDVGFRLILCDEVHLGNGKSGNIDTFFRNHGIKISEQIHAWDNRKTKNHVVGVSATPYAHVVSSDLVPAEGPDLFRLIYDKPISTYNSMESMRKNGRLRPSESIFEKNGSPTSFLTKILNDFRGKK